MSDLTRLSRPAQTAAKVDTTSKQCLADGFNYPTFRLVNKRTRVALSPEYLSQGSPPDSRLFTVSNAKGWFAAVIRRTDGFAISVSLLKDLLSSLKTASDRAAFSPTRVIPCPSNEPTTLAFTPAGDKLFVAFRQGTVVVYDTPALFTPGVEGVSPTHVLQTSSSDVKELLPNPGAESNLVIVRRDGTVQIFNHQLELLGGWFPGDAESLPVTAAWSPKGKQLAIGLLSGDICTFTLANKAVPQKHVPPCFAGHLSSISWLAPGHTFLASYYPPDMSTDQPTHQLIFLEPKTLNVTFTNLNSPFPTPDRSLSCSQTVCLPRWDEDPGSSDDSKLLLVVGDVTSVDLEIIAIGGGQWFQQSQENPLSIPLDKNGEDTALLGLGVDLTDTESQRPVMYAYLNDGTIQGWHMDHSKPYCGMITAGADSNIFLGTNAPPAQPTPPTPATGNLFGQATPASTFGKPSAFGSTSTFGQTSTFSSTGFGPQPTPSTAFGVHSGTGAFRSTTAGAFSKFASSPSAFGQSGFSATAPVTTSSVFATPSAPQAAEMTRDTSMSDETPSFGGLSLGGNSPHDPNKAPAGGLFGNPPPLPLPPDHPSNPLPQTSFAAAIKPAPGFSSFSGSGASPIGGTDSSQSSSSNAFGGGSSFKPAVGFGQFASNNDSPFAKANNFGASAPTTPAFSAAPPALSGSETAKPAFGQSSFGQPRKPNLGQSTFGQSSFGQSSFPSASSSTTPVKATSTSGGFNAFASQGTSSFAIAAQAATIPATTQAFGTFASDKPSAFSVPSQGNTSGGAFSAFASNGTSGFGQTQSTTEGLNAFNATKSEPVTNRTSPFGGASFAAVKTESPFSSSNAFGNASPSSVFSSSPFGATTASNALGSFGISTPKTPLKPEPTSAPSSPESGMPPSPSPSPPIRKAESSQFTLTSSASPFKPATGFGAFGSDKQSTSSPFFKTTDKGIKPAVSAFSSTASSPGSTTFGATSALGGNKSPFAPATTSSSPAFGSTSSLGGTKSAFASTPSPAAKSSPSTANAFSAFSGSTSAFTGQGPVMSFAELSEQSDGARAALARVTAPQKVASEPAKSLKKSQLKPAELPTTSSTEVSSVSKQTNEDETQESPTKSEAHEKKETSPAHTTPSQETKSAETVLTPPPQPAEGAEHTDPSTRKAPVTSEASVESLSSQASSYVEVSNEAQADSDTEEAPASDEDGDGDSEQDPQDESDFLSEHGTTSSESGSYAGETEEEEDAYDPNQIALPASRSSSATPQPEPSTPSSTDEPSSPGRLSTIREESTTPPGSPERNSPFPKQIVAPAPTSAFASRPSTKPARSSPLASTPISPEPDGGASGAELPTPKPRPASPKQSFGSVPFKAKQGEAADLKSRPKTPPLAVFSKGPTTPSTSTLFSGLNPPVQPQKEATGNIFGPPAAGGSLSGIFDGPMKAFTNALNEKKPEIEKLAAQGKLFAPPTAPSTPSPPTSSFSSSPSLSTPTLQSLTKPIGGGQALPVSSAFSLPEASPLTTSPFNPAGLSQPTGSSPFGPPAGKSPFSSGPLPVANAPSPFTPQPAGVARGPPILAFSSISPATLTPVTPSPLPAPTPPTEVLAEGMQKECVTLFNLMAKELQELSLHAHQAKTEREKHTHSTAGSARRKEDLGDPTRWALGDAPKFGALLKTFKDDIDKVRAQNEGHHRDLKEIKSNVLKASTRKEEINRFHRAKSDAEFAKVLKGRTLGPEHLETQTQLRRSVRTIHSRIQQLEDHLQSSKKRISEMKSGKAGIHAPSLDTINRTFRNIDIAIQHQQGDVAKLKSRIKKMQTAKQAGPNIPPSARDLRLPDLLPAPRRPLNVTPDVAVTTAAALNAERSAQKLKKALLAARKEPLLNVQALEAPKAPVAFATPGRPNPTGLAFNTPLKGQLFTPVESNNSLPVPILPLDDDFAPVSTPLWSGRRGASGSKKLHAGPVQIRKSPQPETPPPPVAPSFDWGPLPTFNQPKVPTSGFTSFTKG